MTGGSAEKPSGERPTVWVLAGTRTGSSTILSMISATPDDNRAGGDVFSLYEPCHPRDQYSMKTGIDKLDKKHGPWTWGSHTDDSLCGNIVLDVSRCDFTNILELNGWKNEHTSNGNTTSFSRSIATEKCKDSKIIAVKTVDGVPNLEKVSWVLHENPHLKILEVVRDPRGVLASKARAGVALEVPDDPMKIEGSGNQDHNATLTKIAHDRGFDMKSLDGMCENLHANMKFKHPRVHQVVFDDLVKDPLKISKDVYKFLKLPVTEKLDEWVHATFDNPDCDEGSTVKDRHDDCRSDSAKSATKWMQEISHGAKKHFLKNEDCVKIAHKYKFPL